MQTVGDVSLDQLNDYKEQPKVSELELAQMNYEMRNANGHPDPGLVVRRREAREKHTAKLQVYCSLLDSRSRERVGL